MSAPRPFGPATLHVSYSQLSAYLLCPEKFRQRYVLDVIPSHRPAALVFGSAVHAALAVYHEGLLAEREVSLDQMFDELDAIFEVADSGRVPILWDSEGSLERLRSLGRELLSKYRAEVAINKVLMVEKPFSINLAAAPGVRQEEEELTGVVDLVEEDADGQVWITELKTSKKRYSLDRLRNDHQMSIYAAARDALGVPNARLRYRLLLTTKSPAVEDFEVYRDQRQILETRQVIQAVLRAVDHRIFYPLRSWACANCGYRASCGDGLVDHT